MLRRRVVLQAAVAFGLALASFGIRFGLLGRASAGKAERAFSALSRCVFGEPLSDGESLRSRWREVSLGAFGARDPEQRFGDWPWRCAVPARALESAASELALGDTSDGDDAERKKSGLEVRAHSVWQTLYAQDAAAFLARVSWFEDLWAAAGAAGLGASDGEGPRPARIAVPPQAPPSLRSRVSVYALETDLAPGRAPWLLFDQAPRAILCSTADGLKCSDLDRAVPSGLLELRNSSRPDLVPVLFRFRDAWNATTGGPLEGGRPWSVRADGMALHVAGGTEAELVVVEHAAGKPPVEHRLPVDHRETKTEILDDHVVWFENAGGGARLVLARVRGGVGGRVAIPLERFDFAHYTLRACVLDALRAVAVTSDGETTVVFRGGDAFQAPVRFSERWSQLACRDDGASFTGVIGSDDKATIVHTACTASGCATTRVPTAAIESASPTPLAHVAAVGVGDALVVAFYSKYFDAVRLRVARPELIAEAEDHIVFDPYGDGDVLTVHDLALVSAGDHALLLIGTDEGLRVFTIAADGSSRPLSVADG